MSFDQQEERRNKASVDLGAYSVRNNSNKEFNYDLFLNFNRELTDKITFDATAGTNIRRNYYRSIYSTTNTDLVSDGLYTIGNSAGVPVPPVEIYEPAGVNGLFATAGFTFDKALAIDATFRRDQSTTLPPANNSFFYPSVSASYIFSNKLHLDWLSYGRVRASYAEVGNDAPPLSVYDVYDKPTAFGNVALFSLPGRKNNSQLKPERTKSLEFGLDASFFDNRVGFELSYYDARTVDQIIPIQVSGATGYTSKFINSGEVRNKGIELIANFTPVRKKDFVWKFNINYSRNQNEVVSLFDANTKQIVIATFQSGVSLVAIPGQPFGVLKGRGYALTNGQKTVNEDGYYISKTDQIIGNVTPKWQGGVGTSLTFGALTLSCLVDMKIGGSLYSLDQAYGQYTGLYPNTAGNNDLGKPKRSPVADGGGVILDGVKEDGTKNDIRVSAEDSDLNPYGIVNNPNEAFVYDASYVKLRELNITYSIPAKWFNGKTIKGIDVSLIGRNLWIIHKNLPYADPEEVYSAGNVTGHQGGAYPTLRTIGFNLKFKL
jgi:outer membrane receptor protein involved in Fe transport